MSTEIYFNSKIYSLSYDLDCNNALECSVYSLVYAHIHIYTHCLIEKNHNLFKMYQLSPHPLKKRASYRQFQWNFYQIPKHRLRTHESWKSCLRPYPSHQILILEPGKDSIRRKRKCRRLNVYVPELHVEILNPWVIGIGRWLGHKSRASWMGLVPL